MKGIKLTKRGQAVVLALQIIIIAVFVFFFTKAAVKAWEKEYELNAQVSTQAAETYYDSLPHK